VDVVQVELLYCDWQPRPHWPAPLVDINSILPAAGQPWCDESCESRGDSDDEIPYRSEQSFLHLTNSELDGWWLA